MGHSLLTEAASAAGGWRKAPWEWPAGFPLYLECFKARENGEGKLESLDHTSNNISDNSALRRISMKKNKKKPYHTCDWQCWAQKEQQIIEPEATEKWEGCSRNCGSFHSSFVSSQEERLRACHLCDFSSQGIHAIIWSARGLVQKTTESLCNWLNVGRASSTLDLKDSVPEHGRELVG